MLIDKVFDKNKNLTFLGKNFHQASPFIVNVDANTEEDQMYADYYISTIKNVELIAELLLIRMANNVSTIDAMKYLCDDDELFESVNLKLYQQIFDSVDEAYEFYQTSDDEYKKIFINQLDTQRYGGLVPYMAAVPVPYGIPPYDNMVVVSNFGTDHEKVVWIIKDPKEDDTLATYHFITMSDESFLKIHGVSREEHTAVAKQYVSKDRHLTSYDLRVKEVSTYIGCTKGTSNFTPNPLMLRQMHVKKTNPEYNDLDVEDKLLLVNEYVMIIKIFKIMSLISCSNVVKVEVDREKAIREAGKKIKTKRPLIVFKTLKLDTGKKVVAQSTNSDNAEDDSLSKTLRRRHDVRGHIRVYSKKRSFQIWVKEHQRGSTKAGLVLKEYNIKHNKVKQ